MTDERANLPSASAFDQVYHCPGSRNLLNALPPEVRDSLDEPDEQALRGIRIHAAWAAGNDDSLLSEDEVADRQRTIEISFQVQAKWEQDMGVRKEQPQKIIKEERLW